MPAPSICPRRSRRGILLFEASVTVALVTVGLIGIVSTYSSVIGSLKRGTQVSEAARCLDQRWAMLELVDVPASGATSGDCTPETFHWTAEVTPVADTALAAATVSVAWTDRRQAKQVQLVSYVPASAAVKP